MRPIVVLTVSALAIAAACATDALSPGTSGTCRPSASTRSLDVPGCLRDAGLISTAGYRDADSVLRAAQRYIDSIGPAAPTSAAQIKHNEAVRSVAHLADYYNRGLLTDSNRFGRVVDQVAVTLEYLNGLQPVQPLRYRPKRTPGITWVYYQNLGIQSQPVTTVQSLTFNFPDPCAPTDSMTMMGDALYRYAVWRQSKSGVRFPMWEYYFPWNTGGWAIPDPWHSAMAQGLAMFVFTENYARTKDPKWKTRAYEVFQSYRFSNDDGGVMTPDTTHGYWWEEYVPTVQVWNGSVTALLELDFFAKTFNDAEAKRMVARGLDAVKYFTPFYDTGVWLLYSRVQGNVDAGYMFYHVMLADTLYGRTKDPYFQKLADKWRAYTPPPDLYASAPFGLGPNAIMSPAEWVAMVKSTRGDCDE